MFIEINGVFPERDFNLFKIKSDFPLSLCAEYFVLVYHGKCIQSMLYHDKMATLYKCISELMEI